MSMCKNFLRLMFFWCKRLLSDSKSFLACRTAKMSWDELQGDEKGWSVPGWDENSWEEPYSDDMRWGEKSSHDLRWDEVSSAKCKCEVWSVHCEVWGKCLLGVALHRGRAQVMFLDSNTATASHKTRTHGPGWRTAHASSIDEKGLIIYP